MTTPGESNTNPGIHHELAERLGNFHESACALADCLQTRDITRKTDQCMIGAAKCMFHKFLGEASDDLDRVALQAREDLRAGTTWNTRRCSRTKTASERRFLAESRNLVVAPRQQANCFVLVPRQSFALTAGASCRRFSEATRSVHLFRSGEKYELMSSFTVILNLLFAEAEPKGKTRKFPFVHWSWIGRFECRQLVPRSEVQPLHCNSFRLEKWLDDVKTFYH